jgi:hypothetical protein
MLRLIVTLHGEVLTGTEPGEALKNSVKIVNSVKTNSPFSHVSNLLFGDAF